MNTKVIGAAVVAMGLFGFACAGPVLAHENTLQKMGKAIQYTTRKDAENTSQVTHQALGHNSVHHNRSGYNNHSEYVLKPSGHKVWIHRHHHHHHIM